MKSLPSKDAKLKLRRTMTERVAWNSRKVKISEGWRRRGHMGTCSRISFRRIVWGQRCFGPEPSDGVCKLAELSRSTAASTYRYTRGTPFEYGFCNQFTTMRAILESRFFLRFEHKRQTESLPRSPNASWLSDSYLCSPLWKMGAEVGLSVCHVLSIFLANLLRSV